MGQWSKVAQSMSEFTPGSHHRRGHTDSEALFLLWQEHPARSLDVPFGSHWDLPKRYAPWTLKAPLNCQYLTLAKPRRQLPKPARPQQRRCRRYIAERLNLHLPLHQRHRPSRPTHHPRTHHHRHPGLNQQPRSLQPQLPARRQPQTHLQPGRSVLALPAPSSLE